MCINSFKFSGIPLLFTEPGKRNFWPCLYHGEEGILVPEPLKYILMFTDLKLKDVMATFALDGLGRNGMVALPGLC